MTGLDNMLIWLPAATDKLLWPSAVAITDMPFRHRHKSFLSLSLESLAILTFALYTPLEGLYFENNPLLRM